MERLQGDYISIDLGHSTILKAYYDGIAKTGISCVNWEGGVFTPSWIQFDSKDKYVIGTTAKNNALIYPNMTVCDIKKNIGTKKVLIQVDGKNYTAKDLYVLIIKQMVKEAEDDLGKKIRGAVITVPATYSDRKKREVMEAGKEAGLEQVFVMIESVAPILNYGSVKKIKGIKGVFDFGGCTFDVSVLEVNGKEMKVTYLDGDGNCGGRDFDEALSNYIKEHFLNGKSLTVYDEQQLFQNVEQAKISLSKKEKVRVFVSTEEGNQSLSITRDMFQECTKHLMDRLRFRLEKMKTMGLEEIYLVGGSSKMPQFQELVKEVFPNIPILSESPEEAVAKGAAVYAQMLYEGKETFDMKCTFASTHTYGVGVYVGKGKKRKIFNMIQKDSPIPMAVECEVYTKDENRNYVELEVFESDAKETFSELYEGELLDKVVLEVEKGLPQHTKILVELSLDENGLLYVSGKEPIWNTSVKRKIER